MSTEQPVNVNGLCVMWLGYISPLGYGQRQFRGKLYQAHRAAFIENHRELLPGEVVRHKCDNKSCVNPDHLEAGSQRDNLLDNTVRGPRHRTLRVTPEQVSEIRDLLYKGERQRDIASRFGIAQTTVSSIKRKQTWSHIEDTV